MKNNSIHSEETSMNEVWKDIKGYEGLYLVSNKGRIKSLERIVIRKNGRKQTIRKNGRKQTIRERILKQQTDKDGYLLVTLCNGSGKMKTFKVHRLVCEAFHKKVKNQSEVNHINEDKLDNRACNLEWVTRKGNCNHGTRNARIGMANVKNKSKPVGQYTRDGELVKIWQSASEVYRQLGFSFKNISAVALGKRKTAYGYVWKYIKEEN